MTTATEIIAKYRSGPTIGDVLENQERYVECLEREIEAARKVIFVVRDVIDFHPYVQGLVKEYDRVVAEINVDAST